MAATGEVWWPPVGRSDGRLWGEFHGRRQPIEDVGLPESLALLYASITLHHDYLEENRITQLSEVAAVHLKYKLAALFGGTRFGHADFADVAG